MCVFVPAGCAWLWGGGAGGWELQDLGASGLPLQARNAHFSGSAPLASPAALIGTVGSPACCPQEEGPVRLLIGVTSACCTDKAHRRRQAVRQTWGRVAARLYPGVIDVRFVLAQPESKDLLERWLPVLEVWGRSSSLCCRLPKASPACRRLPPLRGGAAPQGNLVFIWVISATRHIADMTIVQCCGVRSATTRRARSRCAGLLSLSCHCLLSQQSPV